MHRSHVAALGIAVAVLAATVTAAPQRRSAEKGPPPTIAEKTAKMVAHEGFFTFYWDEGAEELWLEIRDWDQEFLHAISTASGVAGRDRGGWGGQRAVKFSRSGSKVFLIQPGYSYRAVSDDPLERRAVDEAYTDPIIAGFAVGAEEDGRVLINATDFFFKEGARGSVDRARSAFAWKRTKNFPDNTEIEVVLTTTGGGGAPPAASPGGRGRRTRGGGSGGATTVRLHHSLVKLPGPGYTPRRADPRSGVMSTSYMDYASPIEEPIRKRFISRHRLHKKDPEAPVSEAVEPIVYYVDPGAPEPIRSALVEGASWWNEAFEAIGFKDAFRVEVLPADADPMDLRYNMILWTHRPERGWSMGTSVRDPRTGEIICGRVFLGSQRVRQDYLIGSGLLAPHGDRQDATEEILDLVLARTRQLSAHEVGHTLGFNHNFSASTHGGSVMDYPHPHVAIGQDGALDLSNAYDVGIGDWDKVFVAYVYSHFPPGADEEGALDEILRQAHQRGLFHLGTVGASSASPRTHQWDNGDDAFAEFEHVMQVRDIALQRFAEHNIRPGAPLSSLEDVLVPIYLFHRYQTEALSKSLGGVDYRFAARGDGQVPWEVVDPKAQKRALDGLLRTLRPDVLALPPRILALLPPRSGFGGERFPSRTSPTFDPLAAAEAASSHTVGFILQRNRAARLIVHHAMDPLCPSLGEVIDRLVGATWKSPRGPSPYYAEIGRTVDSVVLHHLMELTADDGASTQTRAIALLELDDLEQWLGARLGDDLVEAQRAHFLFALTKIRRFRQDPSRFAPTSLTEPPAGAPIGMGELPFAGLQCRGW